MLNIRTEIRDEATPLLRRLHAQLAPGKRKPLMATAGKALERALREHFKALDADPNTARARKGWPKQNFWKRRVADNTRLERVTNHSATVAIASREFLMKVYGGTIRPGPGKRALAIPLRAEVYGRRPSANPVPGLFVYRSRSGKAFLARAEDDAELVLYYRLVARVTQKRDPRALPPSKDVRKAIDHTVNRWATRLP